jgi:hypothetical protein
VGISSVNGAAPGYNGGGGRGGSAAVRGYYQRIADMLDLDRMGERLPGPPPVGLLARHGKQIRRALSWSLLVLAALAAAAFAGDYAALRYRMATGSNAFGVVAVRPYYAVRLKSGKTEFLFQNPRPESCVHSVIPHLGMSACWYLRRNPEKRTDIDPE